MVTQNAGRWMQRRAYFRAKPVDVNWRPWAKRYCAGTFIGGLSWGLGSLWLMVPGHLELQLLGVGGERVQIGALEDDGSQIVVGA